MNLLMRWSIIAAGVALSAWIVPGITYDDAVTLLIVVALLSVFNAILKPLLVIFTLPFVVLSLGLGIWVINALLFLWVSRLVPGFHVHDFWAAMWGSLIVSLTNMVLTRLLRTRQVASAPPPAAAQAGRCDRHLTGACRTSSSMLLVKWLPPFGVATLRLAEKPQRTQAHNRRVSPLPR